MDILQELPLDEWVILQKKLKQLWPINIPGYYALQIQKLPENTYAAPVKQEHISRVDDAWPYKHSTSHFYFATLASNGLSYGLYSYNHELIAWVFINEYNFLLHLFCKEAFRRTGCAEYVLKWAVNEQLRDGDDIYAYVVEGNYKPLALFKKLGLRAIGDSAFMFVEKCIYSNILYHFSLLIGTALDVAINISAKIQLLKYPLMDILQELPLDQWPILQKKMKQLWPLNVPGYYTLTINLKYPKVREAFQFKVYCPHGDADNGFIGVNVKGSQACILFSPTEDTSKLEEALTKTKLIDWSKRVYIDLLTSITFKSIERVRDVIGFGKFNVEMAKTYLLEGTTKPFTDLRLPDNTYAAPVKQEHLSRVDDTWPYKHSSSHFYFSTLASNGLSYGLYSCNHELMAWVFINEYNFLCHLFCEEAFRRKGCAEYVMKWAVNDQLRDGNDVYVYVVEGNDKPLALFKKLGFKAFDESAFLLVEK